MKKIITLLFILMLLIQIRITAQYVTVPTDTIALGSSATLTPVSDSTILSYSWSTGANTQSIQVSPTVTTKYYVTAYGNSFSETDEGIVLVAQTRTINACASTSSITLAGDTGSSCYFDGENNGNWIFIENSSNGLSIQDSMSLEMWVYPTQFAPDNQYSTLFHIAFGGEGVLIMKDDGQLAFFYGNGVTPNDTPYYYLKTKAKLSLNNWTHIAVVKDNKYNIDNNDSIKIYINGVLDTARLIVDSTRITDRDIAIGAYYVPPTLGDYTQYNFQGYIDEVRLWHRPLSAYEISSNKSKRLDVLLEDSLVGYWKMDEKEGEILYDLSTDENNRSNGSFRNWSTGDIVFGENAWDENYHYSWSNGETTPTITIIPSVASTYTVTTTSDEGFLNVTNYIFNPSVYTVEAGNNQTITKGDSITLTATGGNSKGFYHWDTNNNNASIYVSPLKDRKYRVIFKDENGCESIDSVMVYVNSVVIEDSICLGTCIYLYGDTASSVYYDGENDWSYVEVGLNGSKLDIKDSMTIEAWIYPMKMATEDKDYVTIFHKAFGGEGTIWINNDSELVYSHGYGVAPNMLPYQNVKTNSKIPANTWTHIAVVKQNKYDINTDSIIIYINGVLDNSNTINDSTRVTNRDIALGAFNSYKDFRMHYFKGYIDEVRVWHRALSKTEIATNKSVWLNTTTSNKLVANWRMDEGQGDVISDASENSFIGYLNGYNAEEIVFGPNAWTTTSEYTYSWNTGETTKSIQICPTITTTYSVTTYAHGDSTIKNFEIKVKSTLARDVDAGDSTTVFANTTNITWATGGLSDASYTWNTSVHNDTIEVTPVKSQWYKVTVRENDNCIGKDSVYITMVEDPQIDSICLKDTLILYAIDSASSLRFDGINDYVQIPNSIALQVKDSVTIQMWIYPEKIKGALSDNLTLYQKRAGGEGFFYITKADSKLRFGYGPAGASSASQTITSKGTIDSLTWTHVAVTYTVGDYLKLYINGNLDTMVKANYVMTTTLKDASIGATFNSTSGINSSMNFFSGYIDEVSVWNRVLSQTEINAKMNTPITNPSNELKLNGYWNMNEIYGNMIYDKSGNNNTGYLKPDSANLYQDLPLFGPNVTCNGYSYTWSTGDTTPTKTIIPTTTGTTSYYVTVCNGTDTLVDLFKVIVTKCYKKLEDSEDIIYSKEKNGDFNLVAYPNPFNDDVNISYQLPKATNVNISVYNILGNKIATINNVMQDEGNYSIKCDFFKTTGVYLLRFQTDDRIENIRLIKNN